MQSGRMNCNFVTWDGHSKCLLLIIAAFQKFLLSKFPFLKTVTRKYRQSLCEMFVLMSEPT